MDWMKFASKVPLVLLGIKGIVDRVKGASDADKRQAVIDSLYDSIGLAEFAAGRDLLKDAEVVKLVGAVLDAERAVDAARAALKEVIVRKGADA